MFGGGGGGGGRIEGDGSLGSDVGVTSFTYATYNIDSFFSWLPNFTGKVSFNPCILDSNTCNIFICFTISNGKRLDFIASVYIGLKRV